MGFAFPADHRIKFKEIEKRDKYLDIARELKKTMEHEGDGDTNGYWCTWNNPQMIGKRSKDLEIRKQEETILTTALLRSAGILRRILES